MNNIVVLYSYDLLLLQISNLVAATHERIKRDDASFASDFGGPVAKSVVLNVSVTGSNSNSTSKLISTNSLYACEMDDTSRMARSRRGVGPPLQMSGPLAGLHLPDFHKPLINSPPIGQGPNIGPQGILNSPNNGPNSMRNQFNAFKKRFNRQYGRNDEASKRFLQFKANVDDIKIIQDKRVSMFDAQFDVTKFSDMNFDDFKNIHTGALKPDINAAHKVFSTSKKPKCQKLQWTSRNVFPKARDQLECGSCYAMSVADLILAQNKIESNDFDDNQIEQLSSQYVVDCMNPPNAYKCNGGRPVDILNQLALCHGQSRSCMLPRESCYPYKGKNGTCSSTCTAGNVQITTAAMLDIQGTQEKEIMANLLAWGPVLVVVGVTETWQFYNGTGIIRPRQCTTDQSHAVLITGYDYTTCVPTYTVRNSWGVDWGAKGYVKLEAGKNTCGIAQSVIYACSSKCKPGPTSSDYVITNSNFPGC